MLTETLKKSDKKKEFLKLFIDEGYQNKPYSELEKLLGYQSGFVKVKVSRLKKAGYIELKDDGYHFTEMGNRLYRGSERLITEKGNMDIHLHKIKAKILDKKLLKTQSNFLQKVETIIQIKGMQQEIDYKVSRLNNTDIYIFEKLLGTHIRATSEHILIGIPKTVSSNVDSCLANTEAFFKDVLPKVEKFFDIKLDTHFINQFWISSRHIEYVNHKLALLHKKYDCMDIEIFDDMTGERLLYFDKSGGTINAEGASIRKGVEVAYALEQLDKDLVEGHSLRENYEAIEKVRKEGNITFEEMKEVLLQAAANNKETSEKLKETNKALNLLGAHIIHHDNFMNKANKIFDISMSQIRDIKKQAGQTQLGRFF